jgi:hypothetical protein
MEQKKQRTVQIVRKLLLAVWGLHCGTSIVNAQTNRFRFEHDRKSYNSTVLETNETENSEPGGKSEKRAGLNLESVWAHFNDKGLLRLTALDQEIEIETDYGKLKIPLKSVNRIDFAARLSATDKKRLDDAIAALKNEKEVMNIAATNDLVELHQASYPLLLEMSKGENKFISQSASEVLGKIKTAVKKNQIRKHNKDVVFTTDSFIAGRILNPSLKVRTEQFGERSIPLAEFNSISSSKTGAFEIPQKVIPDPGSISNLTGHQNVPIGTTYYIRVTARAQNTIWGTDVFTGDSQLSTAVLHSGGLAAGETGVVKVTFVASPGSFSGTFKNGVQSNAYGHYPFGYQVEKVEE